LVINSRHLGLDILFIVHSPNHIPPQVRPFVKRCYIGKCTVLIKPSNFEVEHPDKFLATQKAVNAKCREIGQTYGVFGVVNM
jgi:hypothetical protein